MTLDEAYALKGKLVTEIELHEEQLRNVNRLILKHLKSNSGNGHDTNVMESEYVSNDVVKGSKITLRYPKDEPVRTTT